MFSMLGRGQRTTNLFILLLKNSIYVCLFVCLFVRFVLLKYQWNRKLLKMLYISLSAVFIKNVKSMLNPNFALLNLSYVNLLLLYE